MGFKNYATPPGLFTFLNDTLGPFGLDAAADFKTRKCKRFISEKKDSFKQDWKARLPDDFHAVWLNPPYEEIIRWVKLVERQVVAGDIRVVMLLPNDTDTAWFHKLMDLKATIYFTFRRVKFLRDGLPKDQPRQGHIVAVIDPWDSGAAQFGALYLPLSNKPEDHYLDIKS